MFCFLKTNPNNWDLDFRGYKSKVAMKEVSINWQIRFWQMFLGHELPIFGLVKTAITLNYPYIKTILSWLYISYTTLIFKELCWVTKDLYVSW